MKIRSGFVSNSSSASFVIPLSDITEKQIQLIKDHIKESFERGFYSVEDILDIQKWRGFYNERDQERFLCGSINPLELIKPDEWDIRIEGIDLCGDTGMDNFDMYDYFQAIGLKDKIHYIKHS